VPLYQHFLAEDLGIAVPYLPTQTRMQDFIRTRNADTQDSCLVLEHLPVFTIGKHGNPSYIHSPGDIPVVQSDRGGQVTYHGPGQIVIYCLWDLRRRGFGVRQLVTHLEHAMIDLLAEFQIDAWTQNDAPGVYTEKGKIGQIGLRVSRGASYHGLSFNVDIDMTAFTRIDPCGFHNLAVTQLADFGVPFEMSAVKQQLLALLDRPFQSTMP